LGLFLENFNEKDLNGIWLPVVLFIQGLNEKEVIINDSIADHLNELSQDGINAYLHQIEDDFDGSSCSGCNFENGIDPVAEASPPLQHWQQYQHACEHSSAAWGNIFCLAKKVHNVE
jgi:hypothetical protein